MTPDQIDALKELLNKAAKPQEEEVKAEAPQMKNKRQSKREYTG